MRALISTTGLNMGWRDTSLTRSPLIHTSRPSRSDSRYCSPVLIISNSSQFSHTPESAVAVNQWFSGIAPGVHYPANEDTVRTRILGTLNFALKACRRIGEKRLAHGA